MSKRSRSNDDHATSRRRTGSYSPPTSLSINQRNLFEQRKRTKAHAFAEQDTSRKMMDSQRRVRESKRKYSVQLYTMKLEQLELVYRNMMECNRLLGVIRETIPDAAFKKTVFNMRRWIESEILNFIVEFRNSGFYKKLTIDLTAARSTQVNERIDYWKWFTQNRLVPEIRSWAPLQSQYPVQFSKIRNKLQRVYTFMIEMHNYLEKIRPTSQSDAKRKRDGTDDINYDLLNLNL